jgi:transcriptional regulator with XRE-family HTH domain
MIDIGKNLRSLRVNAGKKQQELADLLDISQQDYSKFENNKRDPKIKHLIILSLFYNVSIDTIINGINKYNPAPLTDKEKLLYETIINTKDSQIKTLLEEIAYLKVVFAKKALS